MLRFTVFTANHVTWKRSTSWQSEDKLEDRALVRILEAMRDVAQMDYAFLCVESGDSTFWYEPADQGLRSLVEVPRLVVLNSLNVLANADAKKVEALQEALDEAYNHIDELESVLGKIEDATPNSGYNVDRALESAYRAVEEAFNDALDSATSEYMEEVTDLIRDEVKPFTKNTDLLG